MAILLVKSDELVFILLSDVVHKFWKWNILEEFKKKPALLAWTFILAIQERKKAKVGKKKRKKKLTKHL